LINLFAVSPIPTDQAKLMRFYMKNGFKPIAEYKGGRSSYFEKVISKRLQGVMEMSDLAYTLDELDPEEVEYVNSYAWLIYEQRGMTDERSLTVSQESL
jgi:hypothetical protein